MAIRLELNHSGLRAVLRSSEVKDELERRAERVRSAAASTSGGDYEVESDVGANRARAVVVTADFAAMLSEARDHTLGRSVDAARG